MSTRIFILIILFLLVIFGLAYLSGMLRVRRRADRQEVSSPENPKQGPAQAVMETQAGDSSARARELYEQSVLLRDEMAKLNGGKQSMAILYELYLENKGSPSSDLYKRGFEIRQEQLKVALREYKAVKEELDALPGAEAYRFDFPKDLYVYEELSRIDLEEENLSQEEREDGK